MEAVIKALLTCTAWEMTKPKPYGMLHWLILLLGLPVCYIAARRFARREQSRGDGVLFGVGLILGVTELYKQLFHYYIINNGAYDWSIFPFQLCSVPMYLCLLLPLLPVCPLRQVVYDFMFTYNLLGGIMALLAPPGLCHEYWTLTAHAFLWHLLLVFLGLYLGMSGRARPDRTAFARATALFLVLCVIAFSINLELWEVSEGTANMFYIGPRNSPQPVFKIIAARFGWYVGTAVYLPAVSLGAWLVMRVCGRLLPVYGQRQCLVAASQSGSYVQ